MADMAIGVTAIIAMPAIIIIVATPAITVTIAMLAKRKTSIGEKELLQDVIVVSTPDWAPRDTAIT